ncbi:hypothetical protein FOA52_002883 [Chlamydomonas sp. UWO 241]|nr:hypothetical protein FOA52_002883 [Chlamydomonas sp. UWO 241]
MEIASFNDERSLPCTHSVRNDSAREVQLIWVNFEGAEQLYNVVHADSSVDQETFSTHTWLLKDADGRLLIWYSGPAATLTVLSEGVSVAGKR